MTVTIIAAMSENRVIGHAGRLPWHLPADLRRFRARTGGHAVIMGRRTWESVGRPLPDRRAFVISRDPAFVAERAIVARSFEEAIERAGDAAPTRGEVFVAGGADVYASALPIADRLDLTIVHAELEGDAFFPEFDADEWTLATDERHEADAQHAHAYSFRTYLRKRRGACVG